MARKAREKSATGIYAVLLMSADSEKKLFYDDDDYNEFISRLNDMQSGTVLAFALCDRAACLICRENERGIGWTIKPVTTSYAHYYRACYDTSGGVFERRFRSKPLETAEETAKALACVHRFCEDTGREGYTGLYDEDKLVVPEEALAVMGGTDAYDAALEAENALIPFFMPAAGIAPERKRPVRSKPVTKAEKKPETKPEKKTGKEPEKKAEKKAEKKPESKPVTKAEKKPETKPAPEKAERSAPVKKKKKMPSWLL